MAVTGAGFEPHDAVVGGELGQFYVHGGLGSSGHTETAPWTFSVVAPGPGFCVAQS